MVSTGLFAAGSKNAGVLSPGASTVLYAGRVAAQSRGDSFWSPASKGLKAN